MNLFEEDGGDGASGEAGVPLTVTLACKKEQGTISQVSLLFQKLFTKFEVI